MSPWDGRPAEPRDRAAPAAPEWRHRRRRRRDASAAAASARRDSRIATMRASESWRRATPRRSRCSCRCPSQKPICLSECTTLLKLPRLSAKSRTCRKFIGRLTVSEIDAASLLAWLIWQRACSLRWLLPNLSRERFVVAAGTFQRWTGILPKRKCAPVTFPVSRRMSENRQETLDLAKKILFPDVRCHLALRQHCSDS